MNNPNLINISGKIDDAIYLTLRVLRDKIDILIRKMICIRPQSA